MDYINNGGIIFKDRQAFAGVVGESPVALIEDDREQVVGWKMADTVNRLYKPFYEKMVEIPSLPSADTDVPYNFSDYGIIGQDYIVYDRGYMGEANSVMSLNRIPLPFVYRTSTANAGVYIQPGSRTVFYITASSSRTGFKGQLWFRYTKTTDIAVSLSQVPGGGMAGGDMSRAYYDQSGDIINAGGIKEYMSQPQTLTWTLVTPSISVGTNQLRYAKDATGHVYLSGFMISSAIIPTASTLFTFPAGFKPAGRTDYLLRSSNTIVAGVAVSTTGAFTTEGAIPASTAFAPVGGPFIWGS